MSAPPPPAGIDAVSSETLSYGREQSPDGDRSSIDGSGLTRGSRVHRYTILDRVGEGGMGVVYAAYDPSLDRRVALKFLVPQDPARQSVREARLVREAQAMARLSHPNVAVVYEVGSFEGSVFLAMEFVDGVDLRAWLSEEPRSRAQIMDVFLGAGRGLADAHAAGIVHRDFKPENVLVDDQDRPRVTDFGLSRSSNEVERSISEEEGGDVAVRPSAQLSTPLTRTGGMVGTPSYMAPEQHLGAEADARADQFAFCVALYEALHGVRPFAGATPAEIAEAIEARRIEAGKAGKASAEVPRWLRAVLMRGLESRAEDRWPSMEALLAALGRDPRSARLRWMLGGVVAAGLVVAAALLMPRAAGGDACPSARDRVAAIWDAPTRAKVRAAFLATGSPIAADVFGRVERALDGRLESWVAAHREACVATRVRGEQSEALLDLRMQCLERARRQIAALPDVWSSEVKVDAALLTARTAGELEACSDPESLTSPKPRPGDPAKVRELEAVQQGLDQLPALHGAGRVDVGLPLVRDTVRAARELSYPSVLAEALEWNARMELDFGNREIGMPMLYEAFRAANEAHDDARASRVSTWLLYYGVRILRQKDKADLLGKIAEAATSRVPSRQDLVARLMDTQAVVLWDQGKHAEAIERARQAIALQEKLSPADDYELAAMHSHLSIALADHGQTDEAIAACLRALAGFERVLGGVAPRVAVELQNLSLLQSEIGDHEASARSAQRGLDIRSKLFPPDHPEVATALANLAAVRMEEEKFDEATALFERSAAIREKTLGPDNGQLATVRNHLAWMAVRLGDTAKARRLIDLVLPVKRKIYGDLHHSTGYAYSVLGFVLRREGRLREARAIHQKELTNKQSYGDDRSWSAEALDGLAAVALVEKKPQEAVTHLEQARAALESEKADQTHRLRLVHILNHLGRAYLATGRSPDAIGALRRGIELAKANGPSGVHGGARARFELARAMWSTDRGSAIDLATTALDVLSRRSGRPLLDWVIAEDEVAVIKDWLRRHPAP